MNKKQKLKRQKQLIAGIGFGLIGLYMVLVLNEVRGTIPFVIAIGILLWRFK